MANPCNICGGLEFAPGPGGRNSTTGKLPYCLQCGTLERHRTFRQVFLQLHDADFSDWKVLQFSGDRSNDPAWFAHHETSWYGAENSLDLMKIARDSDSYDLAVCNHVMEHVQYDNAAMAELIRVIKPTGFVFLTFPDPTNLQKTVEWAQPRADQHYHWRVYGKDVDERFRRYIPMYGVYSTLGYDPVTGADDRIFLLTKTGAGTARLRAKLPDLKIVNEPATFRS
jgi:SAM-dependent methyltransferase